MALSGLENKILSSQYRVVRNPHDDDDVGDSSQKFELGIKALYLLTPEQLYDISNQCD